MKTLTPEQLDMIKRLQPLFKEKMSEWQIGDQYYYQDDVWIVSSGRVAYEMSPFTMFIPKPIDWQNPERGLWGMVEADRKTLITTKHGSSTTVEKGDCANIYAHESLMTSLLKALCKQEGV